MKMDEIRSCEWKLWKGQGWKEKLEAKWMIGWKKDDRTDKRVRDALCHSGNYSLLSGGNVTDMRGPLVRAVVKCDRHSSLPRGCGAIKSLDINGGSSLALIGQINVSGSRRLERHSLFKMCTPERKKTLALLIAGESRAAWSSQETLCGEGGETFATTMHP